MIDQIVSKPPLDQEWVELILLAKTMGYTPEEIREFFQKHSKIVIEK